MKKIISVIAGGAVFCLSLAGCAGAAGVLAVDTEDKIDVHRKWYYEHENK